MLLPSFCAIAVPARAQTSNPQQTLNQYVADLQSNPNDTALREKIIALVQTMSPPPGIPEEARRHYVMAQAFKEKATVSTGFASAIEQYKAALLAAPWWADAYEKLAMVQKAADRYDDAIASLNLYLLTQPADARDAQDEIYKLEADKQAAAQATAQAAMEEQQRRQREEENSPQRRYANWLKGLDGARFVSSLDGITYEVRGNQVFESEYLHFPQPAHWGYSTWDIHGNTFSDDKHHTFTISDNGSTITGATSGGATRVYTRQ